MKEQILQYGVCTAIAVGVVAITSLLKIIVCAIAKRCGKNLSGNVKEYLFTPIALVLAALGEYIWLDKFVRIESEEMFILLIVCFSLGTMLIYWLLFQPTRKAAVNLIRAIVKRGKFEPIVETVERSGLSKILNGEDVPLHSNAENSQENTDDKLSTQDLAQSEKPSTSPPTAEEKLKAMVNALKSKSN